MLPPPWYQKLLSLRFTQACMVEGCKLFAPKLGASRLVLGLVTLQADSHFSSVHRLRAFSHAS